MEKKLINEYALSINGAVLELAMKSYVDDKRPETMATFIQALVEARFLVPVEFPKKMGAELIERLKKGEQVTPEELPQMLPLLLSNKKGEHFAPAFTAKEQLPENHGFMAIMPVGLKEIIRICKVEAYKISGILLNPNTDNLILNTKMIELLEQVLAGEQVGAVLEKAGIGKVQSQKITMTVDQFHAFSRKNVELGVIPRFAFQDKEKFFEKLEAERGQLLYDYYKSMYKANVKFPYEVSDFDVMSLDIREDLTIISLGYPLTKLEEGGASSGYIVWNPATKNVHYFVIDYVKGKDTPNLGQVTPDGKYKVIGEAPTPGAEMAAILEMLDNQC